MKEINGNFRLGPCNIGPIYFVIKRTGETKSKWRLQELDVIMRYRISENEAFLISDEKGKQKTAHLRRHYMLPNIKQNEPDVS